MSGPKEVVMPTPIPREEAELLLQEARELIVYKSHFFASLVLGMPLGINEALPAPAATDGSRVMFNPLLMGGLLPGHIMGILAHEVMHAALVHPWRRAEQVNSAGWDRGICNVAMDLVVNNLVLGGGFELPEGCLVDTEHTFDDWTWEEVYEALLRDGLPKGVDKNLDQKCRGKSKEKEKQLRKEALENYADNPGDVMDPEGTPEEREAAKMKAQQRAMAAAAGAKMAGELPAGIDKALKGMLDPKIPWTVYLRDLARSTARDDYDPRKWQKRALSALGVGLPRRYSEVLGEIHIYRDTSGSVWDVQEEFLAEALAILKEGKPTSLVVVDCDSQVDRVVEFAYGRWDSAVGMDAVAGGGGTSFIPPFLWLRETKKKPVLVVYFTDLEGPGPGTDLDPGCPVLWVWARRGASQPMYNPPFGQIVEF